MLNGGFVRFDRCTVTKPSTDSCVVKWVRHRTGCTERRPGTLEIDPSPRLSVYSSTKQVIRVALNLGNLEKYWNFVNCNKHQALDNILIVY